VITIAAQSSEIRHQSTTDAPLRQVGVDIAAVSMPFAFGARVLTELRIALLAGPVLVADGSITFLTEADDNQGRTVPDDLLPLGVRYVPNGTPLAVPDGGGEPALRTAVIGAARRVAARL
jgi:hypothetical protein